MTFFKTLTAILMVTLISGMAMARGPGKDDTFAPMERHFSPEKMKSLNLTDEQKTKLKALRQERRAEVQKMREELEQAKTAFKESIQANASKDAIMQAFQKMIDKKSQLAKTRLDGILAARDLLTDEQKAKLFNKGQ